MRKLALFLSVFLIVSLILILSVQATPDTETLRPNAAGTYQEWETLVDTNHWGATSDDTDTTYIKTTGSSTKRDIQNLTDSTFSGATDINVTIKVRVYVSGSGAPEKINLIGYDNVNNGDFTSDSGVNVKSARGVWTDFTGTTMDVNPVTSAEWTQTEIDSLEAGLQVNTLASGEYIQCSEIWVVVDYTVGGQNYVADLSQSISSTWNILTETDYNVVPSQSLSTSWNILTEWDAIADISQSLSTSWTLLTQTTFNIIDSLVTTFSWIVDIVQTTGGQQYIVDLSQAISTTWTILTQWDAITNLTQTISTAWQILTQSTFKIVPTLSLATSWIVDIIKGVQYSVDLSLSITTSWVVDIIYTVFDPGSFTEIQLIFRELLYGKGALIGSFLIMTIIFMGSLRNKYLALFFIPITILMGFLYIENIPSNSDLTWLALISFLSVPFLVLRVAKGK